jgi:predicted RecA/RadA family phage recombinase
MQNFIQEGEHLEFTNGTGSTIKSGSPVFVGKIVGVALGDVANGAKGQMRTEGVFEFAKKASLAISAGDVVFWDSTPGEVTKTDADGVFIGYAVEAVAGAGTKVKVMIQSFPGAIDGVAAV